MSTDRRIDGRLPPSGADDRSSGRRRSERDEPDNGAWQATSTARMEALIQRLAGDEPRLGAWLRTVPPWQRLGARLALARTLGAARARSIYEAAHGAEHPSLRPGLRPRHADALTRMEAGFGVSFAGVTLHTASSVAAEAGAAAVARGAEVHVAPGEVDLESPDGERLLAHELAHLVQQGEGRVAPTFEMGGRRFNDDPRLEREADRMADAALARLAAGAPPPAWGAPRALATGGAVAQRTERLREVLDTVSAEIGDRGIDQQMHLALPAAGFVLAGMRLAAPPERSDTAHAAHWMGGEIEDRYVRALFHLFDAIWAAHTTAEARALRQQGMNGLRPLLSRAQRIRRRLTDATLYDRLQQTIHDDIEAPSAELRARTLPDDPSLRRDASANTGEAEQPVQAHGATIQVHGANALERAIIQATLERMPPAHVRAMPRIVFGGTAGRGAVESGGNTVGGEGARVELTHSAFAGDSRSGFSRTLMHEMGHVAASAFGLADGVTADDLGDVAYAGVNRREGGDSRGGVWERWANSYQRYFTDPRAFARQDRTAARTVERQLRRAVAAHGAGQVPAGWTWQFTEAEVARSGGRGRRRDGAAGDE